MEPETLGMPPAGLRGKVAIVTGVGRPKSVGAAVCRAFASSGVAILFTYWLPYGRQLRYPQSQFAWLSMFVRPKRQVGSDTGAWERRRS